MVGHADMEVIVMKEEFYSYRSLETGYVSMTCRVTWGVIRDGQSGVQSMAQSFY